MKEGEGGKGVGGNEGGKNEARGWAEMKEGRTWPGGGQNEGGKNEARG